MSVDGDKHSARPCDLLDLLAVTTYMQTRRTSMTVISLIEKSSTEIDDL